MVRQCERALAVHGRAGARSTADSGETSPVRWSVAAVVAELAAARVGAEERDRERDRERERRLVAAKLETQAATYEAQLDKYRRRVQNAERQQQVLAQKDGQLIDRVQVRMEGGREGERELREKGE